MCFTWLWQTAFFWDIYCILLLQSSLQPWDSHSRTSYSWISFTLIVHCLLWIIHYRYILPLYPNNWILKKMAATYTVHVSIFFLPLGFLKLAITIERIPYSSEHQVMLSRIVVPPWKLAWWNPACSISWQWGRNRTKKKRAGWTAIREGQLKNKIIPLHFHQPSSSQFLNIIPSYFKCKSLKNRGRVLWILT